MNICCVVHIHKEYRRPQNIHSIKNTFFFFLRKTKSIETRFFFLLPHNSTCVFCFFPGSFFFFLLSFFVDLWENGIRKVSVCGSKSSPQLGLQHGSIGADVAHRCHRLTLVSAVVRPLLRVAVAARKRAQRHYCTSVEFFFLGTRTSLEYFFFFRTTRLLARFVHCFCTLHF